jgi:hypothetical protein
MKKADFRNWTPALEIRQRVQTLVIVAVLERSGDRPYNSNECYFMLIIVFGKGGKINDEHQTVGDPGSVGLTRPCSRVIPANDSSFNLCTLHKVDLSRIISTYALRIGSHGEETHDR